MPDKKILLIYCIATTLSVSAQTRPWDSTKTNTNEKKSNDILYSNKGVFNFGAGIGYSTIDLRLYGISAGGGSNDAFAITTKPAYNAFIDYGLDKKNCIGFGFAYQHVSGHPLNEPYDDTDLEQITRVNIGLRFLHYTGHNLAASFYYGGRIGISVFTDNLPYYLAGQKIIGA
jgi:hypothetical protein